MIQLVTGNELVQKVEAAAKGDADSAVTVFEFRPKFLTKRGSAKVAIVRVRGAKGKMLHEYVLWQHGSTGRLVLESLEKEVTPQFERDDEEPEEET